jgi:hypothetical protein
MAHFWRRELLSCCRFDQIELVMITTTGYVWKIIPIFTDLSVSGSSAIQKQLPARTCEAISMKKAL